MSILCVIPARFASTRLPAKPIAEIQGKPLVMWAYDTAVCSGAFDKVCIATDHQDILDAVQKHGGVACMTSTEHTRGTDRVFEAARQFPHDFIVNLQGDEPNVPLDLIRDFVDILKKKIDDNSLLTLVSNGTIGEKDNANVVKAVLNNAGEALYFSRSAIPHICSGGQAPFYRHTGIYGFSYGGLGRFCSFDQGVLEQAEKLEQLRAMEHGMRIHCLIRDFPAIGIDTPADLARFREMVSKR